jgi:hypothetical protein
MHWQGAIEKLCRKLPNNFRYVQLEVIHQPEIRTWSLLQNTSSSSELGSGGQLLVEEYCVQIRNTRKPEIAYFNHLKGAGLPA